MEDKRSKFIIRPYQSGDEYAINNMFNEVFNQNRELSAWYWKYRDNPHGSYFISLASTEDGALAAHYAGYPVKLYRCTSVNGTAVEIRTFQLGDKMTRKRFRSAGFGKNALLAKTFMHFKKTYARNVPFGYGFGAHHSLRFGLMFLGYADIEPVPYRRVDLNRISKLKVNPAKSFLMKTEIEEMPLINSRWTEFFLSAAHYYKYLVVRDAAYLKWRYLQRPDRKYLIISVKRGAKLAGWSVFYRVANKIIWGDALFKHGDSDCIKSALKYLQRHSISNGADFIECWFPKRPEWWDSILQSMGFEIEAEPNNLHFTGPVFADSNAPELLRKDFYYTIGDSDLF